MNQKFSLVRHFRRGFRPVILGGNMTAEQLKEWSSQRASDPRVMAEDEFCRERNGPFTDRTESESRS